MQNDAQTAALTAQKRHPSRSGNGSARRMIGHRRNRAWSTWRMFSVNKCSEMLKPGSCAYYRQPSGERGCGFFKSLDKRHVNRVTPCAREREAVQLVSDSLCKAGYPGPLSLAIAGQLLNASRGDVKSGEAALKSLTQMSLELERRKQVKAAYHDEVAEYTEVETFEELDRLKAGIRAELEAELKAKAKDPKEHARDRLQDIAYEALPEDVQDRERVGGSLLDSDGAKPDVGSDTSSGAEDERSGASAELDDPARPWSSRKQRREEDDT